MLSRMKYKLISLVILCMVMLLFQSINFWGISTTMVYGATLFNDNFDGNANNNNWITVPSNSDNWAFTNNTYNYSSTTSIEYALNGNSSWSNYSIQADLKIDSWNIPAKVGLIGRYKNAYNYYFMVYETANGRLKIYRKNDMYNELIGTSEKLDLETNNTYTFRLDMNNGTLKGYLGDSLVVSGVDSAPIDAGSFGLYSIKQPVYFDNVIIKDASTSTTPNPTPLSNLDIFNGYPRVHQFRQSETKAATTSDYETWKNLFSAYDGIEGKVLAEEIVRNGNHNLEWFKKFKDEYPKKMVLTHFNSRGRDPHYNMSKYFAGHWLYFQGCKGLENIAATSEDTTIKVENTALFSTNVGRFKNTDDANKDDIVICVLGADGKPDWNQAEQVALVSIDSENSTITVKRGQYGTSPRAFLANQVYLAPHANEGPYGRATHGNHLMWVYNMSTDCPKDSLGKNAADVLAEELGGYFKNGGPWETFDGVALDLSYSAIRIYDMGIRGPVDANGDGIVDGTKNEDSVIVYNTDAVNNYSSGFWEFGKKLREKIGDEKLIIGDGQEDLQNQRNTSYFNGVESEGWPNFKDIHLEKWSTGYNRTMFWQQHGYKLPASMSYNMFKWRDGAKYNQSSNINRLFFAAAQFQDAFVTVADYPEGQGAVRDWDELVKGSEKVYGGWLGDPIGITVRMAKNTNDLLSNSGVTIDSSFISRFSGNGLQFTNDNGKLKIHSNGSPMIFRINNVPTTGTDLMMFCTLRAAQRNGRPSGEPRQVKVRIYDANGNNLNPGKEDMYSYCDLSDFEAFFYHNSINVSTVNYEFEVEGTEDIWLSNVSVHAAQDMIYREFENGVVLANASNSNATFNINELFPGKSFYRIQGSQEQDPTVNNGEAVGTTVTLGPKDGLFLAKGTKPSQED